MKIVIFKIYIKKKERERERVNYQRLECANRQRLGSDPPKEKERRSRDFWRPAALHTRNMSKSKVTIHEGSRKRRRRFEEERRERGTLFLPTLQRTEHALSHHTTTFLYCWFILTHSVPLLALCFTNIIGYFFPR